MTYHLHTFPDADAFLQRAEAWLLRSEAEYNLLIGLAYRFRASQVAFEPPLFLATVEHEGEVVGCAFRTPPLKLGLTRMPEEAIPLVVEAVAGAYDTLPAVLGPHTEAQRFAELWSQHRHVRARPGMRQRIYRLTAVSPPDPMAPGYLRVARPADTALVTAWLAEFNQDTGVYWADPQTTAERLIDRQDAVLWIDDGPVTLAGCSAYTLNGARIAYVYTPHAFRRHGYASACVAAFSQRLLNAGLRFCCLYTDLANPTSNSIYSQIGYRPVCDVMDFDFS